MAHKRQPAWPILGRTQVRREDPARNGLSGAGLPWKASVPAARRPQHRSENARRPEAQPARWKHGRYSETAREAIRRARAESRAERARMTAQLAASRQHVIIVSRRRSDGSDPPDGRTPSPLSAKDRGSSRSGCAGVGHPSSRRISSRCIVAVGT